MAPSRRRSGGSKASAAAAACRQWKVGDLVLAKVKGFPAWPATVSEPEKWGYSVDWKKVLVYFFGTKQIAFCNPADVEAFTEEKKESLLIKRHRKGADFKRAVHEIIDSYEKLKKQDHVADSNSGDEVTVTNTANASESLDNFEPRDQAEVPKAELDSCLITAYSGSKCELSLPVDGAVAAKREGALHDRDPPSEEPNDNLVVVEKPIANTYFSRRRLGGVQPQSHVTLNNVPSARRSRSSLRADSSKFQKFNLPSSNGGKNDGSVTRNKRARKSPDVSEGNDADSPAFLSSGSMEENGSEIATVESDTVSLNEGSTVESGCKVMQPESVVECGEGDIELIQTLDFQTNGVLLKKKRKPNRKRVKNYTSDVTARPDKEAVSEVEALRIEQVSPNTHELSNERYPKEDGDEHLPLVKRARVRMGRLSSTGDELDTAIQLEERSSEVLNNVAGDICTSLRCGDVSSTDKSSFVVESAVDNSSALNKGPEYLVNKPQLWGGKKSQQFGCSVDGESALPPSKRLHRALEAMSANATENGQRETCSEMPSTMKTLVNGFCISSMRDSSNMCSEKNPENMQNSPVTEECAKSLLEVAICNNHLRSFSSPSHESCDVKVEEEAMECSVDKDLSGSYVGTQAADHVIVAQSERPGSPNLDSQAPLSDTLPSKDDFSNENPNLSNHRAETPVKELDPIEHSGRSSDSVVETLEISKGSSPNGTSLLQGSVDGNCETTKLQELTVDEDKQVNTIYERVKEIKPTQKELDTTPSTSAKVMEVAVPDQTHLSRFLSKHDDRYGEKDVLGIRSSSSPAEGSESAPHPSPPNKSICNSARSNNCTSLENNDSSSPGFRLHHAKPKHVGKWNNKAEATAALALFESILRTLTRTKESIARATRIAIDCARFGYSAKVVEILLRSLEKESSLHRRVDLFFLVDSITRCSQGLKGDVGGIYPSLIQAALPRLLFAAAPPRSTAQENRRQCLKVLRLWLERRVLPESVVRPHIRDLETFGSSSSSGPFCRRPLRTERAFDDPIREMEGMLVDEYGSNSSFQLPGFCMPPMVKDGDEGSDSDGESFEAVTPEHNSETPEEQEKVVPVSATEKHRHILEDVDGELEMEDLAPSCEAEINGTGSFAGVNAAQASDHSFEHRFPPPCAPPLPQDVPPSSPPLPKSPPPHPPPPPPIPLSAMAEPNSLDSKLFVGTHCKDNLQQPNPPQPVPPAVNSMSDAVHYNAPECRDLQMQIPIPDPLSSGSFNNVPVSHPPIRPVNSVQHTDAAPYHLRPPHPAPSNQFSYVQVDQRAQSQREVPPPPYRERFHFPDGGNFHNDHDRMNLGPHEQGENWRLSGHSYSGSHYPDNGRVPYTPAPYNGPPYEPPPPNNRWNYPPRPMNYREFMPHRPPYEGPVPVGMRAPSFWRPR